MADPEKILDDLAAADNLRTLRSASAHGKYVEYGGVRYVNMSGNDYLGLGSDLSLQRQFLERIQGHDRFVMSNPASRLMTGNSPDYDSLEAALSELYKDKSCLVLGSGYLANTGLLPAITAKKDLVLADKYVHASIIDGLRLCECDWKRFNHNDMGHLEKLLGKMRGDYGDVWVVTESLFSMDGDRAPIRDLIELKRRYEFRLYLDEAHAFGVYGVNGAGCAAAEGLDGEVDVIVATFGKAMASCGAFVAVGQQLRELLVNRMRTLIFSTALPPVNLMWTEMMVRMLPSFGPQREHLRLLVDRLSGGDPQATHIVPLMAYENSKALLMAEKFRETGFWVTPIRWPTVPRGKARVRVSLGAALDTGDIDRFVEVWKSIG